MFFESHIRKTGNIQTARSCIFIAFRGLQTIPLVKDVLHLIITVLTSIINLFSLVVYWSCQCIKLPTKRLLLSRKRPNTAPCSHPGGLLGRASSFIPKKLISLTFFSSTSATASTADRILCSVNRRFSSVVARSKVGRGKKRLYSDEACKILKLISRKENPCAYQKLINCSWLRLVG